MGQDAYVAAKLELWQREYEEEGKKKNPDYRNLVSRLCGGISPERPKNKSRKIEYYKNTYPEVLDIYLDSFMRREKHINLLKVHHYLYKCREELLMTDRESTFYVANIYLWKKDTYFCQNKIPTESNIFGDMYRAFITKKSDIHSDDKIRIFWREEMLHVLKDVGDKLRPEQKKEEKEEERKKVVLGGGPGTGKSKLMFMYAMSLAKQGKTVMWVNLNSIVGHLRDVDLFLLTQQSHVQFATKVSYPLLEACLETGSENDYVFLDGWNDKLELKMKDGAQYNLIIVASVGFAASKNHFTMVGWQESEYLAAIKDPQLEKCLHLEGAAAQIFEEEYLLLPNVSPEMKLDHLRVGMKHVFLEKYVGDSNDFDDSLRSCRRIIGNDAKLREAFSKAAAVERLMAVNSTRKNEITLRIANSVLKQEYLGFYKDMKGEMDQKTTTLGNFPVLLFSIQQKNKRIETLKVPEEAEAEVKKTVQRVKDARDGDPDEFTRLIGKVNTETCYINALKANFAKEKTNFDLHLRALEISLLLGEKNKKEEKAIRKDLWEFVFDDTYKSFVVEHELNGKAGLTVDDLVMKILFYVQQTQEGKLDEQNGQGILDKSLEVFLVGKVQKHHLTSDFVRERLFYFKHFYGGSSARYMFEMSIPKIHRSFMKALVSAGSTSGAMGIYKELKSKDTGGEAPSTKHTLRVPSRYRDDNRNYPDYDYTSKYVLKCVMEYCEELMSADLKKGKGNWLVGFLKQNDDVVGRVFEGIFFRMVQLQETISIDYYGAYGLTSAGVFDMERHRFPGSKRSIVEVANHSAVVTSVKDTVGAWIKPPKNNQTWDAAIRPRNDYLFLLQITKSQFHKVDFSVVATLLRNLREENVEIRYLEFAFLVLKKESTKKINFNVISSALNGVTLVNGGFKEGVDFGKFQEVWPSGTDMRKSISMYVMPNNQYSHYVK